MSRIIIAVFALVCLLPAECYDPFTVGPQKQHSGGRARSNSTLLKGFLDGSGDSKVNEKEWDVQCGGGLCSRSDPLCCGTSKEYCIPGGQKCCSGGGGLPGYSDQNNIASCGIEQECCQGGADLAYAIDCCNKTQSCIQGKCQEDQCANTTSQDYCLATSGCSWCCYENKCQSKMTADGKSQCGTDQVQNLKLSDRIISLPATRSGPQSPQCNACNLITSCSQCVAAVSSSHIDAESGCTWCAQTQSCWPAMVLASTGFCNNDQSAHSEAECQDVGPTGHGLHLVSPPNNDFGTIVLGTFGFTILAIVGLALFRYIMFRRRMREFLAMMDPNGDFGGPRNGSGGPKRELCKKFGFRQAENTKKEGDAGSETAEGDNGKRPDPLPAPLVGPQLVACVACGADTRLPVPKTEAPPCPPPEPEDEPEQRQDDPKEQEPTSRNESADDAKAEEDDLTDLMVDAERKADLTETGGASGRQEQDRSEECAPKVESGGPREMIIALPCYHHLCIVCGRRTVEEGRHRHAARVAEELEEKRKKENEATKKEKKHRGKKTTGRETSEGGEEDVEAAPSTALLINEATDSTPIPITAPSVPPPGSTASSNVTTAGGQSSTTGTEGENLNDLQLQCPMCQGHIECIILPSKIIHN